MQVGLRIGSLISTRVVGARIGSAIGAGGDTPTLVSIAITPDTATVYTTATQQFTATGTYSDTSTADITATVTWDTSDHAKATINAAGLLTGVAAGSCTVSATLGAVNDSTSSITIAAVPQDGPNSWYVPASAADFTARGVTAPTSLWLCQQASGNLSDSIGANTLTAAGTVLYQQALPASWTRKGVGMATGTGRRFAMASGVGPNPGTTSMLWLWYVQLTAAPAAARSVVVTSDNANNMEARVTTTPAYRCTCATVDGTGASNAGTTLIRAVAFQLDRANSVAKVYTDQEVISTTYSSAVADGNKGIGASGIAAASALYGWGCLWTGADAEVSQATVKDRMQKLGITIPW